MPDFIADDKFEDAIEQLIGRGWDRIAHLNHPKFDLKWRNFSKINFATARPHQILNHFENAHHMSDKAQLCNHLRRAHSDEHDISSYFPLCWDLQSSAQLQSFLQYFAFCRARQTLQRVQRDAAAHSVRPPALAAALGVCRKAAATMAEAGAHRLTDLVEVSSPAWHALFADDDDDDDGDEDTAADDDEGAASATDEAAALLGTLAGADPQACLSRGGAHASVFIAKPSASSCGRGISCLEATAAGLRDVVETARDVDFNLVVQK
jgi:hypothetical protein